MTRLRFYLDEHVNPAVASGLRLRGIEVSTTQEANLEGASDKEQLAFALREGCVLVTHDEDFLSMAAAGADHAGILYCHQGSRSIGQLIRAMEHLATTTEPSEFHNRVHFL
jgi:predicted nuclease of predicted toxin-antitoxin system